MTAIDALLAERAVVLEIGGRLGPADWAAPSGCAGWSVQDLVAHLGALYWLVVDPSTLPDVGGLPTETAQDRIVVARRSMTAAEVLADYETVSAKAVDALAELGRADFEVPLGDLGTYPAAVLPTSFCFDHYTHIRADLFAPRGPLGLAGLPPSDELRLAPALDWIAAALPQQNVSVLGELSGVVDLVVEGPGGRTIRVGPAGAGASGGTAGAAVATVRSGGDAFIRWITQRGDWETLGVSASGDATAQAGVRRLKVF